MTMEYTTKRRRCPATAKTASATRETARTQRYVTLEQAWNTRIPEKALKRERADPAEMSDARAATIRKMKYKTFTGRLINPAEKNFRNWNKSIIFIPDKIISV